MYYLFYQAKGYAWILDSDDLTLDKVPEALYAQFKERVKPWGEWEKKPHWRKGVYAYRIDEARHLIDFWGGGKMYYECYFTDQGNRRGRYKRLVYVNGFSHCIYLKGGAPYVARRISGGIRSSPLASDFTREVSFRQLFAEAINL